MAKKMSLIDTLNDLRARELAVIVQYMGHHYVITGADAAALAGEFKEVAITEMKHAEELAERIDYLGGVPVTKPAAIKSGATNVTDAATVNLASEEEAIALYIKAVAEAAEAGDITTRKLLEDILGDEEDHANTFRTMLGK